MAEKENLLVEGYRFGSYQDAKLAEEEQKKAEYFKEKTAGRSARNLLAVYDKMLDEKIFATPVGWAYLKEVQEELRSLGLSEDMIRPIPMYVTFCHMTGDEIDKTVVRQRIRPSRKKAKTDKFKISLLVNVFFVILVLAMFAITLNSDNPNILNYKKAVVNQYATWEQELSEREERVKEKERQLQIEQEIENKIEEENAVKTQ